MEEKNNNKQNRNKKSNKDNLEELQKLYDEILAEDGLGEDNSFASSFNSDHISYSHTYSGMWAKEMPELLDKPLSRDEIIARQKEANRYGEKLTTFEKMTGVIPSNSPRRKEIREKAIARGYLDEYEQEDHLWLKGNHNYSPKEKEEE